MENDQNIYCASDLRKALEERRSYRVLIKIFFSEIQVV